jgi:transcription initiation factor IIE alpha subunit
VSLKGVADTITSLRDDDLAYLMGMNTKELHKLCGRLKEDRFLEVYAFYAKCITNMLNYE